MRDGALPSASGALPSDGERSYAVPGLAVQQEWPLDRFRYTGVAAHDEEDTSCR
jgi:hypothetical protein